MSPWAMQILLFTLVLCIGLSQSVATDDKAKLSDEAAKQAAIELLLYSPQDMERLEGHEDEKRANVFRYGKRAPAVFRYGKRAPSVFRYGKRSLSTDDYLDYLLDDVNPAKRIFRYGKRSDLMDALKDFHSNSASGSEYDKRIFRYGKRYGSNMDADDSTRNDGIDSNTSEKDLMIFS